MGKQVVKEWDARAKEKVRALSPYLKRHAVNGTFDTTVDMVGGERLLLKHTGWLVFLPTSFLD